MPCVPSPKKSETLEVRLPLETKAAFMARCRDDGRSASEAVRGFIEGEIEGRVRLRRSWLWQVAVAAIAGLALGAVAAPSLAKASGQTAFEQLDVNGDGVVTKVEYKSRELSFSRKASRVSSPASKTGLSAGSATSKA